jgi:hypothetical protein
MGQHVKKLYTYHVSIVDRQHPEVAVEMLLILPYPSHGSMICKSETIRDSEREAFTHAIENSFLLALPGWQI